MADQPHSARSSARAKHSIFHPSRDVEDIDDDGVTDNLHISEIDLPDPSILTNANHMAHAKDGATYGIADMGVASETPGKFQELLKIA